MHRVSYALIHRWVADQLVKHNVVDRAVPALQVLAEISIANTLKAKGEGPSRALDIKRKVLQVLAALTPMRNH